MGTLNEVWSYLGEEPDAGFAQQSQPQSGYCVLKMSAVIEIIVSLSLLPMAYSDLRTQIDPRVTCSDASMSGGGSV